ncbi:MAG: hypothetical protein PHE15_06070, partial [Dehalococcoidales bacterium]|nr:hypothetical protein [Dehalococcoidales bacterium]
MRFGGVFKTKVFWDAIAIITSIAGGWAMQYYLDSISPPIALVISVIAFCIMYYAIKKSNSLSVPQFVIKAEERLVVINRLEIILSNIE